ncbi:MAG: hypothetical protein JWP73_2382 [Phenylobacterium sp.]|nr:hypothetical protein [Phenylobacterium sp.]
MDLARGHAGLSSVAGPGAQTQLTCHRLTGAKPRSDHLTTIQAAAKDLAAKPRDAWDEPASSSGGVRLRPVGILGGRGAVGP